MAEVGGRPNTANWPGKYEVFCRTYINCWNGTESAREAGYAASNASQAAVGLLARPDIQKRIQELMKDRLDNYRATADRITQELSAIAFTDMTKVLESLRGNKAVFRDLQAIPLEVRAAIKGIKQTKEGVEVTFHDKIGAIEILAKHLGYFEAHNKQKAMEGPAIYLPENNRGDVYVVKEPPNNILKGQ